MLDRFTITKPSRIHRILMKISWHTEQDVLNSILSTLGAETGVKIQFHLKYETQEILSRPYANLREFVVTHVILAPAWGTQGLFWGG